MDWERESRAANEAAQGAAEIIARLASGARESWQKGADDPVTRADLEGDAAIQRVLRAAFPDDVILSEETRDSPARLGRERVWIIDPLDGTKEFVEGIPEYAVSIALCVQGQPVVAAVCRPAPRELFSAAHGRGAFRDAERVQVAAARPLARSRVIASRTETKRGQLAAYRSWFGSIEPVGSVALKLALVAAGRADGWISLAPKNEWDVCAGDLLVREAGGVFVTQVEGVRTYNQEHTLLSPPMAAGPVSFVEEFRSRVHAC